MEKYADLHLHSYYSDGTKSPYEILLEAKSKNIGVMAISDHDLLAGTRELMELEDKLGVKCIPAVEMTASYLGKIYHVLGYGINIYDKAFNDFVVKSRSFLDGINDRLIQKMEKDYHEISFKDYENYPHPREKGGWKALHYLVDKGLAEDLFQGMGFYKTYNEGYEKAGFFPIQTVITEIHRAGGKAVLAHPGKVIPNDDSAFFEDKLRELISLGLDGVECIYPSHSKAVTETALKLCKENNLIITSGSDSHGNFVVENTPIGVMQVGHDKLNLKGLL